jgi:hypothetical protein
MGSSDPILKLLKDFSYAVVRLPRVNIRPLQILEKRGNDLTTLGDVTDLFQVGSATPPVVGADEQAAFINGKRTRDLEIHVGLSLLGGIIGAMTGSKAELGAAYKRASNLAFEFDEVKVNQINQLALNKFLTGAKVDTSVGPIAKALEEGRLYVITSTIKSKKFTTEALQSDGTSVGVEVPILQGAVGGSVGIQTGGSSNSKVTFTGDTPLVFGFQAVRMEFEDGAFKGLKQVKPEEAALRGPGKKAEFEMLETEGPFASLKDEDTHRSTIGGTKDTTTGEAKKASIKKVTPKKGAKAVSRSAGSERSGAGKAAGTGTKGGTKRRASTRSTANKGGTKGGVAKAGAKKSGTKKTTRRA